MDHQINILAKLTIIGFLLSLICACASPSYLNVRYNLPPASDVLQGKKVVLNIIDTRSNKNIFSEKAQKEFDNFDGSFVLSSTEDKISGPVKLLDLPFLFKEALKKRLETMGVEVVTGDMNDAPLLEITLKKFFLDLKDRNWIADISYETKLTRDNKNIARMNISGKGERYKVMGKGAGEKLIGEIFSDSINDLDIQKLFKNVGI
jgi:hypothetical protein